MKKFLVTLSSLVIILLCFASIGFAHPGKTDANGGHYDNSNGEYHYHHGYSAHQHSNEGCPYDFDDKTGENSGMSSGSSDTTEGKANPITDEELEELKRKRELRSDIQKEIDKQYGGIGNQETSSVYYSAEEISQNLEYTNKDTEPNYTILIIGLLIFLGSIIFILLAQHYGGNFMLSLFLSFSFIVLLAVSLIVAETEMLTINKLFTDILVYSIILFITSLYFFIRNLKEYIEIKEREKQFQKEKKHYEELYKNKSLYELANVPNGIKLDGDEIIDEESNMRYGRFTVYHTLYGQCYHQYPYCSNTIKIDNGLLTSLRPCSKCCDSDFPALLEDNKKWYRDIRKMMEICDKYNINASDYTYKEE